MNYKGTGVSGNFFVELATKQRASFSVPSLPLIGRDEMSTSIEQLKRKRYMHTGFPPYTE